MKRTLSLAVAALLIAGSLLAAAPGGASASRIIVREGSNRLVAIPATRGRPRLLVRTQEALLGSSASINGRTVAFSTRSSAETAAGPAITDRLWVLRAGRRARLVRSFVSVGRERGNNPVMAISISPDGRRLLVTVRSGKVLAMRADGGGVRPVIVPGFRFAIGPHPNSSGAKFTPDGRRIIAAFEATTGEAEFACGVGIVPATGGSVSFLRTGRLFGGISRYTAPALSPDGRSPSRVFTVRSSGAILRAIQTEKVHRYTRNLTWVR
jgi:hypothetical protein